MKIQVLLITAQPLTKLPWDELIDGYVHFASQITQETENLMVKQITEQIQQQALLPVTNPQVPAPLVANQEPQAKPDTTKDAVEQTNKLSKDKANTKDAKDNESTGRYLFTFYGYH